MSNESDLSKIDEQEYLKLVDYFKSGFPDMLTSLNEPLASFKKNVYEKTFKNYIERFSDVLHSLEDAYTYSDEKDQLIDSLSKDVIAFAQTQLDNISGKRKKDRLLMDFNMVLVVYFFPALLKVNKNSGQIFSDAVLEAWKEAFPKTNLHVTTYEDIESGFRQRYCYITTAVCQSLHKPDNCEELLMLRDYRDHYLMNLEDGEQAIRDYYDVAPTIVKHIDRLSTSSKVYQDIYHNYLEKCIDLIHKGKKAECKTIYTNMVYDLEDKYFS